MGYSPWGCKELDTTERPHFYFHFSSTISVFPGGTVVKNPPVSAADGKDSGSILGSRRIAWRRKWQPTPVLLPGKSHGRRSLVGYSPWGCKELDTTEHVRARAHAHTHTHPNYLDLIDIYRTVYSTKCTLSSCSSAPDVFTNDHVLSRKTILNKFKVAKAGTSLVVQWLRLSASTVGGTGSNPTGGTKILKTVWCSQNKR